MADLTLTAGDTAPSISGSLTNPVTGLPLDLTTALGVRLQMRALTAGALTIDAAAVIVSPTAGTVRYDLQPGDLVAGDYEMRWQITWNDGSIEHTSPANTITVEAI